MKIEVKDPATGALLNLDAKPERYHDLRGFRIRHKNGSSFFITNSSGKWQPADHHHIEPDFLINIGLALEGKSLHEQIAHIKI